MKATFLGACHEVTGSSTLLEVGGVYALVDFGMPQGRDVFENAPLPIKPSDIDFLFLTHAHVDHSGYIPLLYKNGFRGQIFATAETCDLSSIMLRDCAHIQESEANFKTRKSRRAGGDRVEPLFSLDDAERVMRHFRRCAYNEPLQISENYTVTFRDIGHLLGSAAVELELFEKGEMRKITFSGDVGNTDQPIINDPKELSSCDYLVIESTYGNRIHEKHREDTLSLLASHIQNALDRGGNLIIPSFAVGRTQELLYFIREIKAKNMVKGHPAFPVYVDSPLANEATGIYMQCSTDCFDDEIKAVMKRGDNPLVFDGLKINVTIDESKALNIDPTPKVIISASGMCEAGRICHHLKYNLWRTECTVLFVGYQAEGTLGRRILDGAKSVKIYGDNIAVNAHIETLHGISGHADMEGLLSVVEKLPKKPSQVFVNHGEHHSSMDFAKTLEERFKLKAYAPYSGTVYDLIKGEFEVITEGVPVEEKPSEYSSFSKKRVAFTDAYAASERLLRLVRSLEGIPNKELKSLTKEINNLYEKYKR